MNLPTLVLSTTLIFTPYQYAQAEARHDTIKEIQCLSSVIFAEARGEPKTGQLAVAHASINRSKRSDRSICKIKGVTRKPPTLKLQPYFKQIAKTAMSTHSNVGKADSWNTGKKPHSRGDKVKVIARHVYYVMSSL
jgi:hypothetical protein